MQNIYSHFIRNRKFHISFFLLLTSCLSVFSQNIRDKADSILNADKQLIISFLINNKQELESLTKIISIDKVIDNKVIAYTSKKQFDNFLTLNYNYSIIEREKLITSKPTRGKWTDYNTYPTYEQYVEKMQDFAASFPSICKLDTIGKSEEGRLILCVKISDNVNVSEDEPEFFYSATMHGDELAGYNLMLRLINYLLSNYSTNQRVANLVDNIEIYINPNANPDGTYIGGNDKIYKSIRYNSNGVDLNRNFPDPDPKDGEHPDGEEWQPETIAMMDYITKHDFIMSANFHGGTEVFNYPWDTWYELHPDDKWFKNIALQYVDTAITNSNSVYFKDISKTGIINGYDWYPVAGGRQDYINYFHNGREVTIEIDVTKQTPEKELINIWNYNYRSLLNYIEQCTFGVQGIVYDIITDKPVSAKIDIPGHDKKNTFVFTDSMYGRFYRLIEAGNYNFSVTANEYKPQSIDNVKVTDKSITKVKVGLIPDNALKIKGLVYDSISKEPLSATVKIKPENFPEKTYITNSQSNYFEFYGLDGKYQFIVSSSGYDQYTVIKDVSNNATINFPMYLCTEVYAQINVTDSITKKTIPSNILLKVNSSIINNIDDKIGVPQLITLCKGTYTFEVNSDGYLTKSFEYSLNATDTNKLSIMLNKKVLCKFEGEITDSVTHKPIKAKIVLSNNDKSFEIWTDINSGKFSAEIEQGFYNIEIQAVGYNSKIISNFVVEKNKINSQNFQLTPINVTILESSTYDYITIYPNPVGNFLYFENYSTDLILNITISDIYSNKIKTVSLKSSHNNYIDFSDIPQGMYFINIQTLNNNTTSFKIIKL